MAAPGGKFFVEELLPTTFPHHENFKSLWERRWKTRCENGIYPFMYGAIVDFQPIVDDLIKKEMQEPYDWDVYAEAFFPQAQSILHAAAEAEKQGLRDKASELYLRASAVYRMARFPLPRSEKQKLAWERGKLASTKGLTLLEYPAHEIIVPHIKAKPGEGKEFAIYYKIPAHASKERRVPLVVHIGGLDGYRTDLSNYLECWRIKGCAALLIDVPGTPESPSDPSDPESPERLFSSLLAWIKQQDAIDDSKIAVWSFSTGGYYGLRLAHSHPHDFAGIVSQGGASHHLFDPTWLEHSNRLEYPFDLGSTMGYKFGYGNDFKRFKQEAQQKYSLLENGMLDQAACAKLLLINGTADSVFPIDDFYLAVQHGNPKDVRLVSQGQHMGEPEASPIILRWICKLLDLDKDISEQLKILSFTPKY